MIKKVLFAVSLFFLLLSCNSKKTIPNTDIDVARAFIKDILEDNFTDAETFLLKEETNKEYFDVFQKEYKNLDKTELENYKNADIIINEISNVNDSVTIINYSNSYKKDKNQKVKMVKVNGQWLVDLKYTFSGNM